MAMMPTIVTGGILFGTAAGAVAVDSPLGLLAPLWMGAVLAGAGLLTVLPDLRRPARMPAGAPACPAEPRVLRSVPPPCGDGGR